MAPQSVPVPAALDSEIAQELLRKLFSGEFSCVVMSCYENERPLQGLAGWLDWNFQGVLSEGLRRGVITGRAGECVYVPASRGGRQYHLILAGAGSLSPRSRRGDLPAPSWEALRRNLNSLKLGKVAVSRKDLGGLSATDLQKKLKGVELWTGA